MSQSQATKTNPRHSGEIYELIVVSVPDIFCLFIAVALQHVSASSQSLRFILTLRMYSSFITSRPGLDLKF